MLVACYKNVGSQSLRFSAMMQTQGVSSTVWALRQPLWGMRGKGNRCGYKVPAVPWGKILDKVLDIVKSYTVFPKTTTEKNKTIQLDMVQTQWIK